MLGEFVRGASCGLVLLCVGGVGALTIVVRERRGPASHRLAAVLGVAALALGAAAISGHTDVDGLDATTWVQAGLAASIALVAAAATSRPEVIAAAIPLALALAATPGAAGHPHDSGVGPWLANAAHVAAAALWTGGLAFVALALVWSRGERWTVASRVVPRFSTLAVGSVAVVLATGALSGYLQIRTWHAFWHTHYGVLLAVKLGLVLPLLALGGFNRRFAVPKLARQLASPIERRRFVVAVSAELALVAVIVALTAQLASSTPPS